MLRLMYKLNPIQMYKYTAIFKDFLIYNIVQRMHERGFFYPLKNPKTPRKIAEKYKIVNLEYLNLILNGLTLAGFLKQTPNQAYQINPKNFDNGKPKLPKIDPKGFSENIFKLLEKISRGIWERLQGEGAPFEGDFALADWETMWGSQVMRSFIDVALVEGLNFKELREAKSLLMVWIKNGENLAYIRLKLPWIQRLVGIDWLPQYVEIAQREYLTNLQTMARHLKFDLETNGKTLTTPEVYKTDFMNMPFKNGEFDAVYLEGGIYFHPNRQKVVDEIVRVTKPGGIIFGQNWVKPSEKNLTNTLWDIMIRTRKGASGLPLKKELEEMFAKHGIKTNIKTAIGFFGAKKPE